jgi:hypothetical protein
MFITIISVLLALLMAFYTEAFSLPLDFYFLAYLLVIGGTTILILTILLTIWSLIPLNQLEQKLIPRLVELYRRDRTILVSSWILFLFPLISYVLAVVLISLNSPHKELVFAFWMIYFGLSLDLLKDVWKRTLNFLNPFYLIDLFTHDARRAIQTEQDDHLYASLDSLSEVSLRAIEKNRLALSTQSLSQFAPILQTFFKSAKSISRISQDIKMEKSGQDESSYTIFYLLQRLELINKKALQHGLETVCSQMIMTLGKIIVYCGQFDLSMVSFPTHFLGRFAVKAQQHNMEEVGNIAIGTLLEVARTLLADANVAYAELINPFNTITNSLEAIAKESFKRDKTTSIKILTQPLRDLKTLFQNEKMAAHRDTPAIIANIDRVLTEFDTLEQVMRTIPPIIVDQENNPTPASE